MDFHYECSMCSKTYEVEPTRMLCSVCGPQTSQGEPLSGILDLKPTGPIKQDFNPFDLLPVEPSHFPTIPVGDTPLWSPVRLQKHLNLPGLRIKDDTCNPTGSLKDRASFLVAAFAGKHGIGEITLASTGNAGSSMAGVGAAANLAITLFLPKTTPPSKMIQALQYGARVITVDGNYDMACRMSLQWSQKMGGLSRNTAYNPLTIDGKKTVALEIFKDLGRVPDHVFVPTGDGVILCGVYKGFQDLKDLGLIQSMPVIHAVQAQGSNALARAFQQGVFQNQSSSTVADSICVDAPAAGFRALKYLKTYHGSCIQVSDNEILEAQRELASKTGLFAEPAAAASFAGLLRVRSQINPNALVVILATGNGLKDPQGASRKVTPPEKAISSLDEISRISEVGKS